MPFNYGDNIQAVLNCLNDHNTTTATPYLSLSLTSKVVTIDDGDPGVSSLRADDYPAIFVRVKNASEEYGELGPTGPARGKKMKNVIYEIIALYQREGKISPHDAQKRELYTLARNIEGVFQQEYTLSGTSLFCNAGDTDFVGPIQGEGVMVLGAMVTLTAKYQFR